MIDARNKFSEELFKQFLELANQTIDLVIDDVKVDVLKNDTNEIVDTIFNKEFAMLLSNEQSISLKSDNNELLLAKCDIDWWSDNTRRKNKLKKCLNTNVDVPTIDMCLINLKIEDSNNTLKTFTGTKKQCIDFFNANYSRLFLVARLSNKKVVMNLSRTDNIDNEFYPIEHYLKTGAIIL